MRFKLFGLFVVPVAICLNNVAADEIEGTAQQMEYQNTFVLKEPDVTIMLCGVSTHPPNPHTLEVSREYLSKLLSDNVVRCQPVGKGTPCDEQFDSDFFDGKVFAQCFVNGQDIAERMITAGYSCSLNKYSGKYYDEYAECAHSGF